MAKTEWKQLDQWLVRFVVAPLLILLVLINIAVFLSAHRATTRYLRDATSVSATALDNILSTYAIRTVALADQEELRFHLAHTTPHDDDDVTHLQARWAELSDDDLPVRTVLHNDASLYLAQIPDTDPVFISLTLLDSKGTVLAASQKPHHYDYSTQDWWNSLASKALGLPSCAGVSKEGTLPIILPLQDANTPGQLIGVLRAELDVTQLAEQIPFPESEKTWLALLVGNRSRFAGGDQLLFSSLGDLIVDRIRDGKTRGWFSGTRYRSERIIGGLVWSEPMLLVFLREEGRILWGLIIPVLITLALSVVAFLLVTRTAARAIEKRYKAPSQEISEAGVWVLQSALGRSLGTMMPELQQQLARNSTLTPLQQDLERWLSGLREGFEDEVFSQNTKMQRDLELAKEFQRAMLERPYPLIPDVQIEGRLRLEFFHTYEPASALGGDFFDILTLGPDSAGIFIADVMGHGTRSALITAILRALLGDLISAGRNAPFFLNEVNKAFCHLLKSVPNPLFASAFYFVADTTARVATFSSAGHPPPLHVRRSLGKVTRIEAPQPRGTALGVIPDETYTGGHCRLVPEDVFIFFTDGVYEAHNRAGEEFGIHRMERVLRKAMYKKSGRDIAETLLAALRDFVGDEPVADDVCIVSVEVTTRADSADE